MGGPHGPYRQSERAAIYAEKVTELLANGSAYHCYCTEAELEERNEAARARGEAPGYDGRCRTLTDTEIAAYRAEGRAPVVRFRMPDTEQVVEDLVKGEVRWAPGELRDFVLARADGSPVFLLAVAVDDLLMGITHVVRGDDLLAARTAERQRDRGARRNPARVRARAAGARARPPAAVEAPRLDQRQLVPRAGVPPRGARELPGAPRLVAGRRPRGAVRAGADRGFRPDAGVVEPRGLRHREAHLAEQPIHPVARRRRPRRALRPLPGGGGRRGRAGGASRRDAAGEGADEDPDRVGRAAAVPVQRRHHAERQGSRPAGQGARGLPQGGGRGARCLSGMGRDHDRRDAGRAGRRARA